ncbi:MAG TPA: ATP-binding protein [Burkholderiales bacterium]|nr:ATP-binding protein [Burkholderiales bacterium]
MQPETLTAPLLTRLANTTWSFSQRYWRVVVVAMLALLHVAVFRGVSDPWARALLLAHLGLLLLWQPFLRAEQHISATQGFILALVASAVMLWLDWWFLAFWVVVLAGLVGGKVYQQHARWQRRCYLVVLIYLLALLAVAILPEIAPRREIDAEILAYAEYLLPMAFVVIAFMPSERDAGDAPHIIDFFYSMFVMLLLVVIILGSFTFMTLRRMPYLEALTYTVFLTAGALLLVALAWNPRSGGAGVFFARYLFSIGLPFEKWLHLLAELLQAETRPERFLEQALVALLRLRSVAGVQWWTGAEGERQSGELGSRTAQALHYKTDELGLTIYSRYRLGPALQWHLRLLGLLISEFYAAKLREEKLRHASYLQAVHETGARMTHDIKNLLQSLSVLTSVAREDETRNPAQLQALLRRQLPLIEQRLADTLAKFQRPQAAGESYVGARAWWEGLARQYRAEGVEFESQTLSPSARLPRSLFDTVADNVIRNALAKRAADPAVRVRVSLACNERVALRVCDSGAAVAPELAAALLRAPVSSGSGLGIGLYQAARLAEATGYRLELETNQDGRVCFVLQYADGQGSTPAPTMRP